MKWACEIEEPLTEGVPQGLESPRSGSVVQRLVPDYVFQASQGCMTFVSDIHTSPAFTLHIRHAIRFG